jgi:ring-1,2-phenylacetyl-CoA epoxidase subunit PaaE
MLSFHPLELTRREPIADSAVSLVFGLPPELKDAFKFEAGQHLVVRTLIDGRPMRRTYSIVSPVGGELKIGVRVQGQVSRHLAETVPVGARLDVMTPNGSFHPQLDAGATKHYVAFAAGSGITPILSIMATVLQSETASRFTLFYGNRTAARSMFLDEILLLKNRFMTRFSAHFIMSDEPQDVDIFNGRLDTGKLKRMVPLLFDPGQVDEIFLCGPLAMVETLEYELKALGVQARVHIERFGTNRGGAVAVTPAKFARAGGESAAVTVIMDGRRRNFSMSRNAESILDAAAAAGIELPFSCRAGVCSTCRSKLTAGSVTMERNQALEPWELEAGFVLCCQARPTSPSVELNYDTR